MDGDYGHSGGSGIGSGSIIGVYHTGRARGYRV